MPEPRARRQRLVLAAAVTVFATVLVGQYVRVRSAQRTLERATDAAAFTEARADALVEGLRTDIETTIAEIGAARAQTTDRSAERVRLEAQLGTVLTQLTRARRNLGDTRAVLARISRYGDDVTRCLDGVRAATDAAVRRSATTAAAAMDEARPHCTVALAASSGARFPFDFADPYVLRVGDVYYGYSTNAGAGDVQVIRSTDLDDWEPIGNALAGLPVWAERDATWAPSVLAREGGFVLYYTARHADTGKQCISRAVATAPEGPFSDNSLRPLVCDFDHEGSIDPSPFLAQDGAPWLVWKDGDRGPDAALRSAPLTADGLAFQGRLAPDVDPGAVPPTTSTTRPSTTTTARRTPPSSRAPTTTTTVPPVGNPDAARLLVADQEWEDRLVEGPSMRFVDGRYLLVYSAASWNSKDYVSAYAWCITPTGPCSKPTRGRLLRADDALAGPGGGEIFDTPDGSLQLAYHAYTRGNVGYPNSRYFFVAPLEVSAGVAKIPR